MSNEVQDEIDKRSTNASSKTTLRRVLPNFFYYMKGMFDNSNKELNDLRSYVINNKRKLNKIKEIGIAMTFGIHVGFGTIGGGIGAIYSDPHTHKDLLTSEKDIIDSFLSLKLLLYDKFAGKFLFGTFAYFIPLLFSQESGYSKTFKRTSFNDINFNPSTLEEYNLKKILERMLKKECDQIIPDTPPPYDFSTLTHCKKIEEINRLQNENKLPTRYHLIELYNRILINTPYHNPKFRQYTSWIKARHIFDISLNSKYIDEYEIHTNYATRCWTDHDMICGNTIIINNSNEFPDRQQSTIKGKKISPLYIHINSFLNTYYNIFKLRYITERSRHIICIGNRMILSENITGKSLYDDQGENLSRYIHHISPYKTLDIIDLDERHQNELKNHNYYPVASNILESKHNSINDSDFNILNTIFSPAVILTLCSLTIYNIILRNKNYRSSTSYTYNLIDPILRFLDLLYNMIKIINLKDEPPIRRLEEKIAQKIRFFQNNKLFYYKIDNLGMKILLYDKSLYQLLKMQTKNPYRIISHHRRIIEYNITDNSSIDNNLNFESERREVELYLKINHNQNIKTYFLLSLLNIIHDISLLSIVFILKFKIQIKYDQYIIMASMVFLLLYSIQHALVMISYKETILTNYIILNLIIIYKSRLIYYPLSFASSNIILIILFSSRLCIKLFLILNLQTLDVKIYIIINCYFLYSFILDMVFINYEFNYCIKNDYLNKIIYAE